MKIVNDFPPNFEEIKKRFKPKNSVCFSYGDTLYNPGRGNISYDLLVHEETHSRQQGEDPDKWWNKYMGDSSFRLRQELEAYHNQYTAFKSLCGDREKVNKFLVKIALDLSGPLYDNVVNYWTAFEMIKSYPNCDIL